MNGLTPSRIKVLQKQSTDAMGIFNNALRKLQETNKSIRQEKAKIVAKIKTLEGDKDVLSRLESQNETFTSKINEFLGTSKTT